MSRERKSGAHEASGPGERTSRQRAVVQGEHTARQQAAVQGEHTARQSAAAPAERTSRQSAVKPGAEAAKAQRAEPTRPGSPRRKRRNRIVMVCIVAALLALATAAVLLAQRLGGADPEAELSLAREAYARQDYETALRYARRAAEGEESAECLLLMADCYTAQGNLEKALELLRRMDTTQARVADRIEEIDRQRRALEDADKLTVLGMRFDADTVDLVLDDMGIRDAELEEILQLYSLDNLSLMNNELEDITVLSRLGGLDTLNLSGNRIRDLSPLSSLSELRTLYLDGNPITDFSPLYGLSRLSMLSIRGVELSAEQLSALSAALPGCAILSDTARETAADITIGGVSFKSDVTELDLSGLGIRDIGALADCRNLRWLNLSGNEITDLTALMNLPGLEVLDVSGNELSDLRPLMGIRSLRTLNAADNRLMDAAALGAMTGLTSLDLSGNELADFSGLSKLKNLQILRLRATGITDEDLEYLHGLTLLSTLSLEDNELTDPAMGRLKNAIPACNIGFSELVYLARIGDQEYRSNQTELEIHGTSLTDLGEFDRMDRLETALLSGNKITNIYMLQYSGSRDTLRVLDLSSNELVDISALSYLSAVEELNLSDNRINTVQPLMRLYTLQTLRLDGNPLTQEQVQALREALPDTEIVF